MEKELTEPVSLSSHDDSADLCGVEKKFRNDLFCFVYHAFFETVIPDKLNIFEKEFKKGNRTSSLPRFMDIGFFKDPGIRKRKMA